MAKPLRHGTIEAHHILRAINPRLCIHCTNPKPDRAINTFCPACADRINSDLPLFFLYSVVIPLYAFWIAFLKKTLSRRFNIVESRHSYYERGLPGVKETLPRPLANVLRWDDGDGCKGSMWLDEAARDLLEQVLLTDMQCDDAILLMGELLQKQLLNAPNSPVQSLEEMFFEPKHPTCGGHWTFVATMKDTRRFVVAFTDRQLGWLPIVVPLKKYLQTRIEQVFAHRPWGVHRHNCHNEYHTKLHRLPYEMPPFDMVLEERPQGWNPDEIWDDKSRDKVARAWRIPVEEKMGEYYAVWKRGVEQRRPGCR